MIAVLLLGLEICLGLILRRELPQDFGLSNCDQSGHYLFNLKLSLNVKDIASHLTSTDLMVKSLSKSLAHMPELHGLVFCGIFFPAQRSEISVSVKLSNQVITLKSSNQLSLNDIHNSLDVSQNQHSDLVVISFVVEIVKLFFIKTWSYFSYGYAMILPYPPDAINYQMIAHDNLSNSSFPIFITCPQIEFDSSKEDEHILPITVTIHRAININDAVKFIKIFKRKLSHQELE